MKITLKTLPKFSITVGKRGFSASFDERKMDIIEATSGFIPTSYISY
jgi:hypothetical protein